MTQVLTNGYRLNVERRGEGAPLLLLHGFTGSQETWAPFSNSWAGTETIALDLLGHGQSPSPDDPARFGMHWAIQDIVALLDDLELPHVALLGYSMGGRVALRLALAVPERIDGLILESASPGINAESERRERVATDCSLADRIEREGLAAFIDYWESLPLWTSQSSLDARTRERLRRQRLRNTPRGLANSLRGMGAGCDPSVINDLAGLSMPTLLISGALDATYCDIAAAMRQRIPSARHHSVERAGHAVHLERPAAFAALVGDCLISLRS